MQVDERGHEYNTAVVTAYLCWRKHGQRNSRIGVPAHYNDLFWALYHTGTAILQSTIIYFEHYYTRTVVGRRWRPNHRLVTSSTQDRAWEETILPRSWRLHLIVPKVVPCLASWCREIPFHHQVMSDDIDEIQNRRYHMNRRTFFTLYAGLHGPGWLYVLGMPPRGYLRLWTPRARATDLGQGRHLRRGVRAGSLHAPEPRARETTLGRKRILLRDVCDMKSRGWRKLKRGTKVKQQY